MPKSVYEFEEDDKITIDDGNGGRETVTITDIDDSGVRFYDQDGDAWKVTFAELERRHAELA